MVERIIISENASGKENSFLGRLHEEEVWDSEKFWTFYDALNSLSGKIGQNTSVERELAGQVSKINSYVLNSTIHHFDPNDSFKIKNLSESEVREYLERLNFAVEGFFQGKPPQEEIFDDELRTSIS